MNKFFSSVRGIVLFVCIPFFALAGNEKYISYKAGQDVYPETLLNVQDKNYPAVMEGAQYADSKGIVTLSFNQYDKNLPLTLTQSVEIYVDYYKKDGSKITTPIGPIQLMVDKTAGSVKDKDYIVIDDPNADPYSMTVRVSKVNNSTASAALSAFVKLEASIEVERYYTLDLVTTPFTSGGLTIGDSETNKNLTIYWDNIKGAESYELEYTYVDDYSFISLDEKKAAEDLSYDFRFNSTRVVTDKNTYEFPLTYDRGYILYRVRAKGKAYGTRLYDVFSKWSSDRTDFGTTVASFAHKRAIVNAAKNNFQSTATFAEEGKRKDVISYFDGSLRNRQAVTKSNSTNFYIVGETLYDYEGRAAIQILPIPVKNKNSLAYAEEFTKVAGDNTVIKKSDYVADNACVDPSPELSTTSGASNYYSSANSFTESELEKKNYIPDAEGYPYTQTQYVQDNTGRIRSQSGVGKDFKLGSTHETKYFYGKPEQEELDKLFGTNAGNASNYKKNIVIDGNGEVSVSYVDQAGKVIATALAGDITKTSSLLPLDGGPGINDAADDVTVHLLRDCSEKDGITNPQSCNASNFRQGNSLVFSKELVVPVSQEYKFNYLWKEVNVYGCTNTCYNCVYDLELSIKDECGVDKLVPPIKKTIGDDGSDENQYISECLNGTIDFVTELDKKIDLETGKYTIIKKLTVNENKLNQYLEDYGEKCATPYSQFVSDENVKNSVASLCEELTCQTCLLSLGYDDDLSMANNYAVYQSNYPNSKMSLDDFQKSVAACEELCETVSNCQSAYLMMLSDMTPGNQYAAYDEKSEHWSLSIFNKKSYLGGLRNLWGSNSLELFRLPIKSADMYDPLSSIESGAFYTNEDGKESFIPLEITVTEENEIIYEPAILPGAQIIDGILNENGVFESKPGGDVKAVRPQSLANVADFVNAWQSSWAQYLVRYHPEFCYYQTCKSYEKPKAISGSNYSSDAFDDRLSFLRSYNDAIAVGGPSPWMTDGNRNPNYDKKFPFALLDASLNSPTNINDLLNRDPYFADNTTLKDIMAGRLNNYKGSGKTIKQQIAIATFCGNKYYASTGDLAGSDCPPFGSGTDVEKDYQWQMYSSMYLGEKQAIQQEQADLHCLNDNVRGGFNGCIGEANYNPFNTFTKAYYKTSAVSFFRAVVQPCGFYLFSLFRNKEKRFINHHDSEKVAGLCNQESNPIDPNEIEALRRKSDLSIYLQSGQCPLTRDFETFMNDLASKKLLVQTSPVPLLRIAVTKKLYDWFLLGANNESGPVSNYVPYTMTLQSGGNDYVKNYSISKTSGGTNNNPTNIHVEIAANQEYSYKLKSETGKEYLVLLNFNGTPSYKENGVQKTDNRFTTKISSIRNLFFITRDVSGAYLYTADLSVDVYDGSKYAGTDYNVKMIGSTNIPLNADCDFSNVCEITKEGKDLEALLNAISGSGDLGAVDMAMTPDEPGTETAPKFSYEALLTPSITKYFTPSGYQYTLNSVTAANSIELQINSTAGNEMNITFQSSTSLNVSNIVAFTCFKESSSADNEFTVTAVVRNPVDNAVTYADLNGTVTTWQDQIGQPPVFKFKKCGPPVPDLCKTQAHQNINNVLDFLDELVADNKNTVDEDLNEIFNIANDQNPDNNSGPATGLENNLIFNSQLRTQLGTFRRYFTVVTRTDEKSLNLAICSNDDKEGDVCVEGSTINIPLTFLDDPGNLDFKNIVGFAGLKADYSNNVIKGQAYDFTVYAICKVPATTGNEETFAVNLKMKGTSPFPLAECQLSCLAGKENLVINGDFSDPTLLPDDCGGCYCYLPDLSYMVNTQSLPKMKSPTFGSDYCMLKEWNNKGWGAVIFARRPQDAGLEWDGYDHTNGKGYFLYADNKFQEKDPLKKRVWYQEVFVEPGTYEFTTYAMNLHQQKNPNDPNCEGCKIRTWSYDSKESMTTHNPDLMNYVEERCNLDTKWGHETNENYAAEFGTFLLEDKIFLKLNISKSPYQPCPPGTTDSNNECARALLTYLSPEGLTCKNGWVKITTIWENTSYTGKVTLDVSSIDPYYYGGDFGLDDISFSKVCKPTITGTDPNEQLSTCEEMIKNLQEANAELNYNRSLAKAKADFKNKYIEKCLSAAEKFTYSYKDYEYQYTLYYYDQAGNLVKTVPPQGVDVIKDDDQLEDIWYDRQNKTLTPNLQPQHTLPTTYYYNSLNQLVAQSVPDHEKLNIFSGNAIQGLSGFNVLGIEFKDSKNGYLIAKESNPDPNELYPDRAHIFVTKDGGGSWTELTKLGLMDLQDVRFVPGSNQIAHIVGTNGGLLRTENGGQDWLFRPVGTTKALIRVHFFTSDKGIAIEENGTVWMTENKGQEWVKSSSSPNVPGKVTDMYFNGSVGFIISDNDGPKVFLSTDEGDSWSLFNKKYRIAGLNTIHMVDANKGYAAGENGILLKTTDGGESWTYVNSKANNTAFTEIYFSSELTGCAIQEGKIVYTADGGITWNPTTFTETDVRDIHFTAAKEGYCITASKKIYQTSDGGKTWLFSPAMINITSYLPSVQNTSALFKDDVLVAAGSENGKVYITANWKATAPAWKEISLPSNAGTVKQIIVSGVTSKEAMVVAATSNGGSSLYTTADIMAISVSWTEKADIIQVRKNGSNSSFNALSGSGQLFEKSGTSWNSVSTISSDLRSFDAQNGIVAVGGRKIYKSAPATPYVVSAKSENIKLEAFRGVYHEDKDHVYLVGKDGLFFKYNVSDQTFYQAAVKTNSDLNKVLIQGSKGVLAGNSGALFYATNADTDPLWKESVLSPKPNADLNSIEFVSPNKIYVAGSDAAVYGSSDFGATFTKNQTTANFPFAAISFSGTNGIVVGKSGTLLKTSNGSTWTEVMTIDPLKLVSTFHIKGTSTGYAVGKNGTIVKTTDLGQTWEPQNSEVSSAKNFTSVVFKDEKTGFAAGNGVIIKTTDGGADWNVLTNIPVYNYTSIGMYDPIVIAVADGGKIAKSNDLGASWTYTTSGTANLNSVFVIDSKTAFAVGDNGTILKMKTTSMVDTWTPIVNSSIAGISLKEVYFANNKTGYITGASGTFLKTVDGGDTWIKKENLNITEEISDINFIDDNHAFLSGTNGLVDKLTDYSEEVSSRFWYDELGRLVVSQNAKQFKYEPKRYSYIRYDDLGRIIEVGELEQPVDIETKLTGSQIKTSDLNNWIAAVPLSGRYDVNLTYYDTRVVTIDGFTQDNLRNRVASITYQSKGNSEDVDHASHFSYDIHGNVKELVQEVPYLKGFDQRYKKIRYDYDLISGKVNKVVYQENKADQFMHKYEYDAENRITNVYTSEDGINWAEDATYFYYAHGPLSRTEYGDLKVQGQDFAYTIQGWIKGVNATNISSASDPGKDGLSTSINANIGKDVYSYSLSYFDNDYKAVNSNFLGDKAGSQFGSAGNGYNLYNGNISSMVTTILSPSGSTEVADVQGTAYTYDKLNRIKTMKAYANFDLANNAWLSSGATSSYEASYKYDNNGNITELQRKNKNGEMFDNLKYKYDWVNGDYIYQTKVAEKRILRSNRLYTIKDNAGNTVSETDIDDMGSLHEDPLRINEDNNYGYDEIGNLIKDNSEGIHKIKWNASGKVDMVISTKTDGGEHLKFLYDVQGNRIAKISKKTIENEDPDDIEEMDWLNCATCTYTWYVRDASGNVMSIYNQKANGTNFDFKLEEIPVYGSSRIGDYKVSRLLVSRAITSIGTPYTMPSPTNLGYRSYAYNLNLKYYELSNHLGNVLTVVSDYRTITGIQYSPIVWSSQDYYPFGSMMEGRGKAPGTGSRYGFNGKEKDDEIIGGGNSYDFGGRSIYDVRIGRFISIDPRYRDYADMSPFVFAANNPIFFIDVNGEGPEPPTVKGIYKTTTAIANAKDKEAMSRLLDEAKNILNKPVPPPEPQPPLFVRLNPLLNKLILIKNLIDLMPGYESILKNQYANYQEGQAALKEMASWQCRACAESNIQNSLNFLMQANVTVTNSNGDIEIFTDDPSTLGDFYLQGVVARLESGNARPSDYAYKEYAYSKVRETGLKINLGGTGDVPGYVDINPFEGEIAYTPETVRARNPAGLIIAKAEDLPFKDGSVSAIVSYRFPANVLVPNAKKIISEIKRVLQPGGTFMMTSRSGSFPKEFDEAGFKVSQDRSTATYTKDK